MWNLTSLWQSHLGKGIEASSEKTANADSTMITKTQQNNSAPKTIVKIATVQAKSLQIMPDRLWNSTCQCTSLFRLEIIHLRESPMSKMTCVTHNCMSLSNVVKDQITKTWFINETQG